jgi:hypothetical protein
VLFQQQYQPFQLFLTTLKSLKTLKSSPGKPTQPTEVENLILSSSTIVKLYTPLIFKAFLAYQFHFGFQKGFTFCKGETFKNRFLQSIRWHCCRRVETSLKAQIVELIND